MTLADGGLQVRWQLRDGGALLLDAQLSDAERGASSRPAA